MDGDRMICKECRQKISLYLDNELTDEEKTRFENHISECEDCRNEFEKIKSLVKELNSIPMEELPEGYCKKLHMKLKDARPEEKKTKRRFGIRKMSAIAAALIIVLVVPLALNSGKLRMQTNEMTMDSAPVEYSMEEAVESYPDEPRAPGMDYGATDNSIAKSYDDGDYAVSGETNGEALTESAENEINVTLEGNGYRDRELKIVKNGYVSIETEDYDFFISQIKGKVNFYGGYIESFETYSNNYYYYDYEKDENINLKNGYMTVRIPQEVFDDAYGFITEEGDLVEVVSERSNETDLTKSYYDTENKVENLEAQEARLQELFAKAENIPEIMQIENELTRVRNQIDAYRINLSDIDYRSSMSTIHIEIREVYDNDKIKPVGDNLWERAKESFTRTVNNLIDALEAFVIFIFGFLPLLAVLLVFVLIVYVIAKTIMRKVKK
jgi:chaperonin cofactor prefoldin